MIKKTCNNCNTLIDIKDKYCSEHTKTYYKKTKEKRESDKIYNTKRWRVVRQLVLSSSPMCVICQRNGLITASKVVDHIKDILLGGDKFNRSNLQALCVSCHNRKTSKSNHLNKVLNN